MPEQSFRETLVLMADGSTKRIDEIEVGDKVANSDPESDNLEQHQVTAVHVTDADKDYIDLRRTGTVSCSAPCISPVSALLPVM